MRVRAGGGWVRLGRRRGFLLIVVLMGLLVMSATVASVVRTSWSGTRQAQWEQAAWQAEWLLEAGADFSRAAVRADSTWEGATWRVPGAVLSGGEGEVVARVKVVGERRVVVLRARYPVGGARAVTREVEVGLE
jgi:Tfp pilus assembly protein PilV